MRYNPYMQLFKNDLPPSDILMLVVTLVLGVLSTILVISFVKEWVKYEPSSEDGEYIHPAAGVLIILIPAISAFFIMLAFFLPWHIYLIVDFVMDKNVL